MHACRLKFSALYSWMPQSSARATKLCSCVPIMSDSQAPNIPNWRVVPGQPPYMPGWKVVASCRIEHVAQDKHQGHDTAKGECENQDNPQDNDHDKNEGKDKKGKDNQGNDKKGNDFGIRVVRWVSEAEYKGEKRMIVTCKWEYVDGNLISWRNLGGCMYWDGWGSSIGRGWYKWVVVGRQYL